MPRFREIVMERATRGSEDKIAHIVLRGLISSSIGGNVGDSMVDDMRLALEQAREDDNVRAVVLEVDSPGGEVTASGHDLQRGGEDAGEETGRRLHGFARRLRRLLCFLWRKIFDGE